MHKGFVFAQKMDEGLPGCYYDGKITSVAMETIIFVQAETIEGALQFIIDHVDQISESMSHGLFELASKFTSAENLKNAIDISYVDGDSFSKVIYAQVLLPRLPLDGSHYFLRFDYSVNDLTFIGVRDARTYKPRSYSWFDHPDRKTWQSDVQLDELCILNVDESEIKIPHSKENREDDDVEGELPNGIKMAF